jgi:protein-L-isoaspartate(D-aspartate) O-methyltransferase
MDEPITVSAKSNGAGVARQLLAPRTLAKLIQLAQVGEQAKVLDVGCATGYSTAILAMLAKRVVAVEADDSLAESASRALQKLGVTNAKVVPGSLLEGVPAEAPFDAIVVNGAVELVPRALLEQLKDGGRLVAVLVEGPLSRAQLTLRSGTGFDTRAAFEAPAALLPGFQAPAGFVF